jgi:hypothetical protein
MVNKIFLSFKIKLSVLLIVTSENDLSEKNKEQKREQLNLAFEWKRIDIIKNFIMTDEKDWQVNN